MLIRFHERGSVAKNHNKKYAILFKAELRIENKGLFSTGGKKKIYSPYAVKRGASTIQNGSSETQNPLFP